MEKSGSHFDKCTSETEDYCAETKKSLPKRTHTDPPQFPALSDLPAVLNARQNKVKNHRLFFFKFATFQALEWHFFYLVIRIMLNSNNPLCRAILCKLRRVKMSFCVRAWCSSTDFSTTMRTCSTDHTNHPGVHVIDYPSLLKTDLEIRISL